MTILLTTHYNDFLLERVEQCIEAVIFAFQKNSLQMQLKIQILELYIDKMKYH